MIVGAGPSGAVCSYFLVKGGAKVATLEKEKFPRDKWVCCLQQLSVHAWHACAPTCARQCNDPQTTLQLPPLHVHAITSCAMNLNMYAAAALPLRYCGDAVCTPAIHILEEMGVLKVGLQPTSLAVLFFLQEAPAARTLDTPAWATCHVLQHWLPMHAAMPRHHRSPGRRGPQPLAVTRPP